MHEEILQFVDTYAYTHDTYNTNMIFGIYYLVIVEMLKLRSYMYVNRDRITDFSHKCCDSPS